MCIQIRARYSALLNAGLLLAMLFPTVAPRASAQDLTRYTPEWIRNGFADGGNTHEPWIFLVRRGGYSSWQKEEFDYKLTEKYIKSLAEAGVTVYHVFCYKGFGFDAEKASMDAAAKAAAIAHKYGMKVDTYIQWNTMFYETFFAEAPEAETDQWYEMNVDGTPVTLDYGYAPYRYRICFNHDGYMQWFKEKILRYAVEVVKTDFIHFDNFNFHHPRDVQANPATIAAYRKYLTDMFTPEQRVELFGFADMSHMRPPMWNALKSAEDLTILSDAQMQTWCDFRCWTLNTRLAECVEFVRSLNKEVVIETNPGGLSRNQIWGRGINHPELLQYSSVIWAEGHDAVEWRDGRIAGKWRNYKTGRTLNNFILSYKEDAQAYAENLALNRTVSWLGMDIPTGVTKQYLDFWQAYRDLYLPATGMEQVAVLRSYPSMAYNLESPHSAAQSAEQVLHQRQVPFDIIFDQQLNAPKKYQVLILAGQESLPDETAAKVTQFVRDGGGLIVTGNTGLFDRWRRPRRERAFTEIFGAGWHTADSTTGMLTAVFGKGRAVYLPSVELSKNAAEFISIVQQSAAAPLALNVQSPEWLGVSHDRQGDRDIVHLFNYHHNQPAAGVTLTCHFPVRNAWAVSPDRKGRLALTVEHTGSEAIIRMPPVAVYEVVALERGSK